MKRKILSVDYSKCIHTHTHEYTHYTKHNLNGQQTWGRGRHQTPAQNRKHGRSTVLEEEIMPWGLIWKEFREGFCPSGRARSSHVEVLKTEKVQEPTVESRVWGIGRLRVREAECRAQDNTKHVQIFKVNPLFSAFNPKLWWFCYWTNQMFLISSFLWGERGGGWDLHTFNWEQQLEYIYIYKLCMTPSALLMFKNPCINERPDSLNVVTQVTRIAVCQCHAHP